MYERKSADGLAWVKKVNTVKEHIAKLIVELNRRPLQTMAALLFATLVVCVALWLVLWPAVQEVRSRLAPSPRAMAEVLTEDRGWIADFGRMCFFVGVDNLIEEKKKASGDPEGYAVSERTAIDVWVDGYAEEARECDMSEARLRRGIRRMIEDPEYLRRVRECCAD